MGEARGEPPWLLPIEGLLGSCPAQPAVHVKTFLVVSHSISDLCSGDLTCTAGPSTADKHASMTAKSSPLNV